MELLAQEVQQAGDENEPDGQKPLNGPFNLSRFG